MKKYQTEACDKKVKEIEKLKLTRNLFKEGTTGYRNISAKIYDGYRDLNRMQGIEEMHRHLDRMYA